MFKRILILFSIIAAILLLIITTSYIIHQNQLSKEDQLFTPTGKMVEVNGHQMHVYIEGDGEDTLVFMSGGGTSSPVLDFKSLYSLLSDKYKIVVVEKAGYGFSDITDTDRDIDTILQETREALLKSGVEGPYILFPHSMSGIEALYWAQVYPNEVKAIIGLDMAVPAAYKDYDINMPLVHISAFAANIGFTRWISGLSESDAIKYGTLTDKEKEMYKVIFYRRTATKNMINEVQHIKENAEKVGATGTLDVPMLLFSSNGQGTGWNEEAWNEFQKGFISKHKNGTFIKLDCSHYIHDIEYKRIANESEKYIESLNR
ncbi:alpha/beta hydrolase [Lysinibacillus xylanilyticus]|uniref:alpha/beta hydrolase n=1 Tax=Lysinibacillus xylanilyticus TaxID=582475 RepID=UPI002B240DE8|nr:alpha/beta fold hydrolase [Lysinibacillus xylanilyticus]MEB2300251.1 alpha/beta hydrolase [Lysinibacillus xylanilyticus]